MECELQDMCRMRAGCAWEVLVGLSFFLASSYVFCFHAAQKGGISLWKPKNMFSTLKCKCEFLNNMFFGIFAQTHFAYVSCDLFHFLSRFLYFVLSPWSSRGITLWTSKTDYSFSALFSFNESKYIIYIYIYIFKYIVYI